MTWPKRAALAVALTVAFAVVAGAEEWNDRTTLKFDAPMMIPGATLAPGTYVFKLLDSATNRHIVQIFNEDQSKLIATTNAVPAKRQEPTGATVVKLNPTEAGAPAALKAWFYPGSLYGHEFVYPDAEARGIAQRTKTLVLSTDVPGTDMRKGTLYTYDANQQKSAWHGDAVVMQEWARWNEEGKRAAQARVASPGTAEDRKSTAPMVRSQPQGMRVSVGDLEEKAQQYVGKTVNVTAEVEEVFGPRLFKIDEANWADLDGEVLVYMPSGLAALVREDDRVTVTGTPTMMLHVDLQRELGWLDPDPEFQVKFATRPVIVASRIVGGNNDLALAINVSGTAAEGNNKAVGTSGTSAGSGDARASSSTAPLTTAAALTSGGRDLVGRRVTLQNLKVTQAAGQGFWVDAGQRSFFVLPARTEGSSQDATKAPAVGQSVAVEGVVLEMPKRLRSKAEGVQNPNDQLYIYASSVR